MSDRRPPRPAPGPDDADSLPAWVADALRRPVAVDAARPARIMALVRAAPRPRRPSPFRLAPRPPRWALRRGILAPGGGALLTAALTALLWVARPGATPRAGDAAAGMSATVLRDTVLGDALQDTLRLVRLMLAAPGAARVSAAGGRAGPGDGTTPLRRDPRTGAWTATVVAPRDAVRFAFLVDGRWVPGPAVDAAPRPAPPGGALPGDTI